MSRSIRLALVLIVALPALAQAQAIGPGFELERSGRYADAASIYFTTVRSDPTNIAALLGLERTLFVLNRMSELLPLVQNARARQPDSPALRSLELRVYAGLNEPDSLEAIARRWAASAPQSEAPYREWGLALADRRMWDEARRAFLVGRRTLGSDGILAIELAELEQRVGNWEASATEWGRAVARSPDVEPNAASQLGDAPPPMRDRVARALTAPGVSAGARRLGAEVLLTWGRPNEAWAAMEPTLVTADSDAPTALRRFADRAGLRLELARARIARGELDRAAAALGDDSSVAAIAQRGWIELYRGNLKNAMEAFRTAGPYATDRAAATERTAMMAMLQRIQDETSPELGAALVTLARGDSVAAITALRRTAARFPEQGGRLEVLLLAAQVAAQNGGDQELTAIGLFEEIVRIGGEGAAPPAAELDWARLLVRTGRSAEAIPHLEHLILTYPNSAFVPEARRVLERAKGAIPRS